MRRAQKKQQLQQQQQHAEKACVPESHRTGWKPVGDTSTMAVTLALKESADQGGAAISEP